MSVTIRGIAPILRDLRRINLETVEDVVAAAMEDIGKDAANYPPPPPNSTYRRTDTLGKGWTDAQPVSTQTGNTLLTVLTNGTPYGAWVQGADDQAQIHRGRWRTTDQIAESWEPRVAERIEQAMPK